MKRSLLPLIMLPAALLPFPGRAQDAPLTVRIGYQPSSSVLLVGKSLGFYDRELARLGAKAEWDLFLSGPVMTEAAAGDRVDLMGVGTMPAIAARAGGIDVKVIAKAAFNPATNAVLVKAGSPIRSAADLKGRKVAAQVGSSVHYFLYQVLRKAGLSMGDVELVNLPGPDQGPALESGAVDAAVLWMPYRTQLEKAGRARVIVDSGPFPGGLSLYLARNAFASRNPSLVAAFLKATRETNDYMRRHPEETLQVLAKGSQFSPDVLSESLKGFDWSLSVTPADIRALKDIKDFLLANHVLRRDFDIQGLIDTRYLSRAPAR
jgi:sulfonate transport system substrate-binding protein